MTLKRDGNVDHNHAHGVDTLEFESLNIQALSDDDVSNIDTLDIRRESATGFAEDLHVFVEYCIG